MASHDFGGGKIVDWPDPGFGFGGGQAGIEAPKLCLQKKPLNTIFPGSEYMTNLIIANVETLSHDDGYSYSFRWSSVWGAWPLGPLDPPLARAADNPRYAAVSMVIVQIYDISG